MREYSSEFVKSVVDNIKKLSLNASTNDTLIRLICSDVNKSKIERWVTSEIASIIGNPNVLDAYDDVSLTHEEHSVASTATSDALNTDDGSDGADPPTTSPSFEITREEFSKRQNNTYNCNVSNDVYFLRQAKTALSTKKDNTRACIR